MSISFAYKYRVIKKYQSQIIKTKIIKRLSHRNVSKLISHASCTHIANSAYQAYQITAGFGLIYIQFYAFRCGDEHDDPDRNGGVRFW